MSNGNYLQSGSIPPAMQFMVMKERIADIKSGEFRNKLLRTLDSQAVLHDVFGVIRGHEDAHFIVKSERESKVLQGHFSGMPIVPFVLLRQLYLSRFHIDTSKCFIEANMTAGMVLPGQELIVKADGIYSIDGKQILKVGLLQKNPETLWNAKNIDQIREDTWHFEHGKLSESELSERIIQSDHFCFVTGAAIHSNEIGAGLHVTGHFQIPDTFPFLVNGEVDAALYEEMVAQMVSAALGEKYLPGCADSTGELLTFQESKVQFSGKKLHAGDILVVLAKIDVLNETEGSFTYLATNSEDEEILRGSITGNITELRRIKRAHEIT